MTARWDDAVPVSRREHRLGKVLALLSLDVSLICAEDLGIERSPLARTQLELRRVLGPAFDALVAPYPRLPAAPLLAALDPFARSLVSSFYDEVARYTWAEDTAFFCWGITLMRCAQVDAVWRSLGLSDDVREPLRTEFWASREWTEFQERLDQAFARPLSDWDQRVAVTGLLPPEDEGVFGVGDQWLARPAGTVRQQRFWRLAGRRLGDDGLRQLRVTCQAFLETQADIAPAFGQLYDPILLAHPENTAGDPDHPAKG